MSATNGQTAPQGSGIPFLYIEGHGPSNPVISSGALSTQFVWDATHRVHVHRFTGLEDFRTRSKEIIGSERMWKIFPGMDDPEPLGDGSSELGDRDQADIDELKLQLMACQALAEGEDILNLAGDGSIQAADFIAKCPAVIAVAKLVLQAKVVTAAVEFIKHQDKAAPPPKPKPKPKRKR